MPMSDRAKRIYIVLCIAVPFMLYCFYYYGVMIGNAPYKFSEFKSMQFRCGTGDTLLNQYNSLTGDYQYLNRQHVLVKTKVILNKDDLQKLHRKAAELGFWNFPSKETGDTSGGVDISRVPKYFIQFNYQRKSKTVRYERNYNGDDKLKDANEQFIRTIQKVIDSVQAIQAK